MERLTATHAARRFSQVLDAIEREGETFVVIRRGRAVATIGPAAVGTGHAVKQILRSQAADPDWTSELAELRAALNPEERSWNA